MGGQGPLKSSCVRWEMFDALRRSRMSFSVTLLGHKQGIMQQRRTWTLNSQDDGHDDIVDDNDAATFNEKKSTRPPAAHPPKNGVEVPSEQECFSGVRGVVHEFP